MKDLLLAIRQNAESTLAEINDEASLEEVRVRYLGKKGECDEKISCYRLRSEN